MGKFCVRVGGFFRSALAVCKFMVYKEDVLVRGLSLGF